MSETAFVKLSSSFFLPECTFLIVTHSGVVSTTTPFGNCEQGAKLRARGVASVHTLVFFFIADTKELYCSMSVQPLRLQLSCQDLQTVRLLIGGGGRGEGGSKADAR